MIERIYGTSWERFPRWFVWFQGFGWAQLSLQLQHTVDLNKLRQVLDAVPKLYVWTKEFQRDNRSHHIVEHHPSSKSFTVSGLFMAEHRKAKRKADIWAIAKRCRTWWSWAPWEVSGGCFGSGSLGLLAVVAWSPHGVQTQQFLDIRLPLQMKKTFHWQNHHRFTLNQQKHLWSFISQTWNCYGHRIICCMSSCGVEISVFWW